MDKKPNTTVVTAGDRAFAWGVTLLVASMRRNGMAHPVLVGAMDWSDAEKRRILALGDVTILDIPTTRRCLTCQKPMLMADDAVKTDWVCWADGDGMFIGDCSEWLEGDENEIIVRKYNPAPADFTPANLDVWRRDVEKHCGKALEKSRYDTRANAPFIVVHRKWRGFLQRWQEQIEKVLPSDVAIVMAQGSPYFQTDESVLGSLLCFDPDAPGITGNYKANGSVDKSRYFAHFAYNPKPWQMWNKYSMRWHEDVCQTAEWLVERGVVKASELPLPLRRGWKPFYRAIAPLAPWVWRAKKLRRKLFKR